MKGSLSAGRIVGVPIRLHWSLVLLVLFAIGPGISASTALFEAVWIVIVFACVLAHELAHSVLARHRGFKVRAIVLMPLGGFSEIIGIHRSPKDEWMISVAGPLTNCFIAASLSIVAVSLEQAIWPPTLFGRTWLVRVIWANVMLAGLNLLPALPLDGGRALRALLARSRDQALATAIAARTATTIAIFMIVAGAMFDLWLALIGVLVLIGAGAEEQLATAGELLHGVKVKDVMVHDRWCFQAGQRVESAAPLLRQFPNRSFAVADDGAVIGIVSASDLAAHPRASVLRDAADTLASILGPEDDLYPDALDAFAECGRTSLPVADGGQPVGLLYASDVDLRLRERARSSVGSDGHVT
ncbi:MAG: site-2 protease family protein [Acidimicrobiales bacterium]